MKVDIQGSGVERSRGERNQLDADGFTFIRSLIGGSEIERLKQALALLARSERAGLRGLLQRCPEIAEMACSRRVLNALAPLAGAVPFPVRGILFDKSSSANWGVTWHQDLAIAVKERADVPGFGPWSLKDGVVHAHASACVLERMLTVRIHLDDAGETNGALRVVPGSHLESKLADAAIERIIATREHVTCTARAGDALVMRPLLLHASSPAAAPSHRRVIHIEYAIDELPAPLQWFERVV